MNAQTLVDAIESAGFEVRSYSGRGMNGRYCLGVVLDRNVSSFELAAKIAGELLDADDADAIADLANLRVCQDSMGLGVVVYFPAIPYEDEDEDEDEAVS